MANRSLLARLKDVKILLLDVDGVLTDGRIVYDSTGRDMKFFDVHDGMGVAVLRRCGIPTVLITAKRSQAIRPRAADMQVDKVYDNVKSKSRIVPLLVEKYGISAVNMCFVGDDLVDIGLMRSVGLPIAVANACPEVKKASLWVTSKKGGSGAVRQVCEAILKAQGKWRSAIKAYE